MINDFSFISKTLWKFNNSSRLVIYHWALFAFIFYTLHWLFEAFNKVKGWKRKGSKYYWIKSKIESFHINPPDVRVYEKSDSMKSMLELFLLMISND